ncbi:MAG TPA: cob(I)yrinic acid a,c-diamide adenosyltransferase [Coriobacteriia bacterium]
MARIYTRTGDEGSTSLPDGTRVPKNDPRIELFGALDEANCLIGLARVNVVDSDVDAVLEFLQHRLFNCSACLATGQQPGDMPAITPEDVASLESAIDRFTDRLGGFRGFMLPGCDETSARLHVARAVVRRAERVAAAVVAEDPTQTNVPAFLNRASDLLYAAARFTGAGNECAWRPDAERP